jgi:MSHA biogenesis protein MshK
MLLAGRLLPTGLLLLAATVVAQDDPTQPPTASELARFAPDQSTGGEDSFRLQSVLISPQRRVAIVNDRRVSVGETVDGARVAVIEPGGVVLETAERTIELKVRTWSDSLPQ